MGGSSRRAEALPRHPWSVAERNRADSRSPTTATMYTSSFRLLKVGHFSVFLFGQCYRVIPSLAFKYCQDFKFVHEYLRQVWTLLPAPSTRTEREAEVELKPSTLDHWDSSTKEKQFLGSGSWARAAVISQANSSRRSVLKEGLMFFPDHCLLVITSCHSHSLLLPHHEHCHDGSRREFPFYGLGTLTLPDPVDPAPSTSSEGPRRVRPSCSSACLCNKSHVSKRQLRGERQHPGYSARHTPLWRPALTAINASPSSYYEVHRNMRGSTGFQGSLFQAILGTLHTPHIPPSTQCSPLLSMCC